MVCERCVQGGVLEGDFTGEIQNGAYFAPAPGSGSLSSGQKTCIVFLTDIFGLSLKNCKIMADSMAQKLGVDVWVPDQFDGKPPVQSHELNGLIAGVPGEKRGFLGTLKLIWLFLRRMPLLIRSRPSVGDARVAKFVQILRNEQGYKKVGVVGYCWGGSSTLRLASKDLFNSAVVFHPGPVSLKELQATNIPIAFGCAEEDDSFPLKLAHQFEAALAEKKKNGGPDFEFKEYMGVCHGFAARPAEHNPVHKERFTEAFNQTISWFEKTLKEES